MLKNDPLESMIVSEKAPQNLGFATPGGLSQVASGPGKGWDSERSPWSPGPAWNCNLENVLEETSEAS